MFCRRLSIVIILFCIQGGMISAQTDTTLNPLPSEEETEDYGKYEQAASSEVKSWCNPKIFDLSPNRFVSLGYDYIFKHKIQVSPVGAYQEADTPDSMGKADFTTMGLRVNTNIPLISKSRLLWQLGGGYMRSAYRRQSNAEYLPDSSQRQLFGTLGDQGLHALNINSTVFTPLNDKYFLIVQLMTELNGNFSLGVSSRHPDLSTLKHSGSILYGKRPHDRFQWAVGISRTYRAGELNYIPVLMYNYTSVNRKWGTEILFPAKAAYRRKFNPRSIMLIGYELEGNSYRLYNTGLDVRHPELRRSELRFRLDYQRQLIGFFWISAQAGLRHNYTFHMDSLGADNKEFFRGFFGSQTYVMLNTVSPAPYINISINLVSP